MSIIVGIDVHKDKCIAAFLNRLTGEVNYVEFFTTRASIRSFAEKELRQDMIVAIEATCNAFFVASELKKYVRKVIMVAPEKHHDGKKTDKTDAYRIALSVANNTNKPCWMPSPVIYRLRELAGFWVSLNEDIIRLKNKICALLMENGIRLASKDVFSQKGREELDKVAGELPPTARMKLRSYLRHLDEAEEDKATLEKYLASLAVNEPIVHLLMTIPGISFVAALIIIAEIGDISRFSSPKKLTKYAGLVPSVNQSGNHCYMGRITKAGRKRLRWILVQAANNAVRVEGRLRDFYLRLKPKKGHNKAIVACARKMLVIIWHMLTNGEIYRDCVKRLYNKKKRIMEKKAENYVEPDFSDLASQLYEFLRRERSPEIPLEDFPEMEGLVKFI